MQSYFRRHVFIALVATLFSSGGFAQEEDSVISAGKSVGFEYTVKLADGTVVDTNVDGEPFTYVHGDEQILPALEAALVGMAIEEEKSIALDAAQAYGEIDPDAFQEVPLEAIPEGARRVGAQLRSQEFPGPIRVAEVREETIVLDLNNPLAGQALTFDVRILSIE